MKSFKEFIAEELPTPTEPPPGLWPNYPEENWDPDFWFPWMHDDPNWWPDEPSDKYPDPTEPVDLPDPGSQFPWDIDSDDDDIIA